MRHRMRYKSLIIICIMLAIVALGMLVSARRADRIDESIVTESEARTFATAFVAKLKVVSFTQESDQIINDIQSQYGSLVTSELLQSWIADPSLAPGRTIPDIVPDRLIINLITPLESNFYRIDGEVVYVSNVEEDIALTEPVTIVVGKTPEGIRISSYDSMMPPLEASLGEKQISAKINSGASIAGIVILPTRIIEDSRCPMNARCIQAGTVKIAAEVTGGGATETVIFDLATEIPSDLFGKKVRLVSVTPEKMTGDQVKNEEYSFVFEIE